MIRYFSKKIFAAALTLWVVATLTFALMKFLPGDPFTDEKKLPPEIHKSLTAHYGLDKPWSVQYLRYLEALAKGDLGLSFVYKERKVNDVIKEGFPVSFILGIEALILALGAGISLGAFSALWENRWPDRAATVITTIGISIPSFAIASFLQYFIAVKFGWLPVARWGAFSHTVLPAVSLAALPASFIARLVRAKMSETLEKNYIKTAFAKGLAPSAVLWRHVLRNSCIPLLGYLGQLSANIFVGSFVVEKIFSIPGLGQWLIKSVLNRDYTMIMGLTLFYAAILISAAALFDVAYGIADPRMRPWRKQCA